MHAHALDSMDCEQRCKKETNGAVSHQVNPAMSCTASVIERVRQIVGQLARRDAGASVGASVRYFPVPTSMRIEHALRRIHSWRCDEPASTRRAMPAWLDADLASCSGAGSRAHAQNPNSFLKWCRAAPLGIGGGGGLAVVALLGSEAAAVGLWARGERTSASASS